MPNGACLEVNGERPSRYGRQDTSRDGAAARDWSPPATARSKTSPPALARRGIPSSACLASLIDRDGPGAATHQGGPEQLAPPVQARHHRANWNIERRRDFL